ncbi:hypothetical protein [Nostoc sp. TCL26-01]|uniref:hypothetical protein n=1 Tax=Nostoc sp. TCL26-01 TaxID=2576904 RepID=UPI0015BF890B|nr:hypothetical protein [Nostoc sp. TCL26-01]QLE55853.1 hypothetical protein FD725_10155 [Nostoc sp. TCL26-01]
MSSNLQLPVNTSTANNIESSNDVAQTQIEPLPTLLPRAAWDSQLAYLRVLFRAKKALDRIEQAATLKS